MRQYPVDTRAKIRQVIEKKLKKSYLYEKNSYSKKGTLIVGILDPAFAGFKADIEISSEYLITLATEIQPLYAQSCFDKILLVDAMKPFDQDPDDLTYVLKDKPPAD